MRFPPCVREYLKFRGGKFGKSRGAFVEVPYFLDKYDPDALRFYLTATLPGTRDTEACPERSRRILLGGFRRVEQPCPERSQAVQASAKSELPPGQALREPAPLFKKLDESVIEEEYARLEG